jgi:penicillin amidase
MTRDRRCLLTTCLVVNAAIAFSLSLVEVATAQVTVDSLRAGAAAVAGSPEGEMSLPGLKEPVEVLRDRWGIAHIYARNQDDLFFAQGFVVAQDRLFQLDLWRRIASGETAELVGEKGLAADRFARLMKYRGPMDVEWAAYAPDTRSIAEAFTRGINAAIDAMGERLPLEFQILKYRPAKWRPEDILGRMSGLVMVGNYASEAARSELISAVGLEAARRIAPTDPVRAFAPLPELDIAGINRTLLSGYEAATSPLPWEPDAGGSNNWVVDGTLSASGKPLLAGDPHRALTLPSLRYLVHLNAPGWNVIGAGEPALPGVAIGHNDHVAWAFTIVSTDQADLYVEQTNPDDPSQYRDGDRWRPMSIVREQVRVKGRSEPVELELRFTHHGPIIHSDEKRHRAFALRWVGMEPGSAAYLSSLRLDRVRSAKEFVEELSAWKVPALNMTHADLDGNIGWVAAGATPIRDGWDGLLPVPGHVGKYEWRGFRTVAELPQSHNPANHFLATANHNILTPGYQHPISYEWAPPYRFEQIRRRMEAQSSFHVADFCSIQQDATTIPGQELVRLLSDVATAQLEASSIDPACRKLLREWDGVLSIDSRAAVLYGFWLQELTEAFYAPHVPKSLLDFVRSRGGVQTMLAALKSPDANWFGSDDPRAARDKVLAGALAAGIARAKQQFPEFPRQGSWGELHTATFAHPLARLGKPYAEAFNTAAVPKAGDGFTPNAATHGRDFRQTNGASYRQVFDLADWDRGVATSAPGQSGRPGNSHYDDLLRPWSEGEYFPLMFSRTKIEEATERRIMLMPAAH